MMHTGNKILFSVLLPLLTLVSIRSFGSSHDGMDPIKRDLLKQDSVVQKAKAEFNVYARYLYREIGENDLSFEAFRQGLTVYLNLKKEGQLQRLDTLTIIDFSLPSNVPRFFIVDLCHRRVIHKSLVAHGVRSGRLYPKHFSNENNSHKSSLGFYITGTTYRGKFDLALRLEGMEYSNSHARSRGVVMHGADYASYDFLDKNGCQLGRSYGCPSLPHDGFEEVVEMTKEGSCLFIYYPSRSYKKYTRYLNRKGYHEDFVII